MGEYNTPYEIYVITSDRHWYVGSASGAEPYAERRFDEHMSGYRKSRAKQLQSAIAKWGADFFSMEVLESGCGDFLAAEQFWYDLGTLLETRRCLNGKRPFIGGLVGDAPANKGKPSVRRGVPQTPEWIEKRTSQNIGSKRTPEQCANIAASTTGRQLSPEHLAKIRKRYEDPFELERLALVALKGSCSRWFISRGKPCHCGQHEVSENKGRGEKKLGAIKIAVDSRVRVKALNELGTVKSLNPLKSGGRGRPKTIAVVTLDSGSESEWGIKDLKMV